jgi:hypothetical protein
MLSVGVYDLPRRADIKVAWHLLDRRVDPSSKEGNYARTADGSCAMTRRGREDA